MDGINPAALIAKLEDHERRIEALEKKLAQPADPATPPRYPLPSDGPWR